MASPAAADEVEDIAGQHMVAEALLAAHLVAVAEKVGLSNDEVRAILRDVAAQSIIEEFWITDPEGRTEYGTEDIEFTFSSDPNEQPQASAFWPLLTGDQEVVVQQARKRELDDRLFKYAGVAGIDRPRIVQVGIAADRVTGPAD